MERKRFALHRLSQGAIEFLGLPLRFVVPPPTARASSGATFEQRVAYPARERVPVIPKISLAA
ncbi:hypothetical protein WJ87_06885 [Burkholderia ubonensis]|nr:hypothetical protein WJ87_06885 [Burkholderia ubonensis]